MPAWAGLWNNVHGEAHSLIGTRTANERMISRLLDKPGMRSRQAIMTALNGAAVGETASASHKRAEAVQGLGSITNLGGERTVETKTDINRVTTSADETAVDDIIDGKFAPVTYPTDAAGNGGGGKANSL